MVIWKQIKLAVILLHLHHPDCHRTQVAVHPKPISKGTLKTILKQTEFTVEELRKLLK